MKKGEEQGKAPMVDHPRPGDTKDQLPNQNELQLGKAEEEKDEDDDEDEDAEEARQEAQKGKGCAKAKKSMSLTEDDLQKSLDRLAALTQADSITRKQALLAKAQRQDLSKSEQDELFNILGGPAKPTTLADAVTSGLKTNSNLQKALDVSDYLSEQHTQLCKSLDELSGHVEASDNRQHEFNIVLAKAVRDVGQLVKSMSEVMGVIGNQPARAPKSQGIRVAAPLQKSFMGDASGATMNKSQVLDTMEEMFEKSFSTGQGGVSASGHNLAVCISKYEQTGMLDKTLLADINTYRSAKAQ